MIESILAVGKRGREVVEVKDDTGFRAGLTVDPDARPERMPVDTGIRMAWRRRRQVVGCLEQEIAIDAHGRGNRGVGPHMQGPPMTRVKPVARLTKSRNAEDLVGLDRQSPWRVRLAIGDRSLGVARPRRPVHGLQEAVLELQIEVLRRVDARLRIDEF